MISPPPCFLGMRLGQWRGGWVGECYHHSIYCRNGLHGHVYLFVCVCGCVCVFVLVCVILVFLCWWLLLTGMIGIGNGPSSVTASVAFRVRTRTWTSCWPTSQASHFLQREKERQKDRQTDRQTETDREGNASMLATADRQSISQSWQMAKRNSGPWMPQESLKNPSRIPPALHLSFSGRVIRKWLIIPHKEQSINQSKRNTRINKIGLIGMNVR